MTRTAFAAVGFAVATTLAPPASALPVSADITETLDLPIVPFSNGPRVLQNLGATFGAGAELDVTHEVQNPSGWIGFLVVDVAADGLSFVLTHAETLTDFQTFSLELSNIAFSTPGEQIASVSRIGPGIVDSDNSDPFAETLGFTGDSITLNISANDVDGGGVFSFFEGGRSSYQIVTGFGDPSAAIPAPAAAPLLAMALAGFGLLRRRRR